MDELLKKLSDLQEKMDKALLSSESTEALRAEIKTLQEDFVKMKVEMDGVKKASSSSKVTSIPGLELEKDKFSLMRAINAISTKSWKNAGFELEVFQNSAKASDGVAKTMSTEVDSAGGYVVPIQALGDFIELLRANLITKQLGATVLEGLVGSPVEMPGQAGGATVYWLGEDHPTGITASDLTLKQSQMTPHMAGALVKLSNRLLRMSNPAIEGLVKADVAFAMAEAIDKAALFGSGSGAEPLGIQNIPGILTYDAVSPAVTAYVHLWKALTEMEYKLAEANALKGSLGYAFHPRIKKFLSLARTGAAAEDGFGQFVANPSNPVTKSQLEALLGYPYAATTNMAITSATPDTSNVIFGNWKELIIGVWQGLTIMASQEASDAFAKNQTWIRIVQECDVMVRHKESFCLGSNFDMELTA